MVVQWSDRSNLAVAAHLGDIHNRWDPMKPSIRASLVSTIRAMTDINEHEAQVILKDWMSLALINDGALLISSKIMNWIVENDIHTRFPESWRCCNNFGDDVMCMVRFFHLQLVYRLLS